MSAGGGRRRRRLARVSSRAAAVHRGRRRGARRARGAGIVPSRCPFASLSIWPCGCASVGGARGRQRQRSDAGAPSFRARRGPYLELHVRRCLSQIHVDVVHRPARVLEEPRRLIEAPVADCPVVAHPLGGRRPAAPPAVPRRRPRPNPEVGTEPFRAESRGRAGQSGAALGRGQRGSPGDDDLSLASAGRARSARSPGAAGPVGSAARSAPGAADLQLSSPGGARHRGPGAGCSGASRAYQWRRSARPSPSGAAGHAFKRAPAPSAAAVGQRDYLKY